MITSRTPLVVCKYCGPKVTDPKRPVTHAICWSCQWRLSFAKI